MVELLEFLVVAFSYEYLESGLPLKIFKSTRLFARLLQTKFLFAFDLHNLSVVHRDLYCTKPQIAQGALDFTQDRAFVLTVNAAKRCAHGVAPLNGVCRAVGGTAFGVGAI